MAATRKGNEKVIEALNAILELELAGVVRYTHYSLMVFGHARIPIVQWMREQADESLAHAVQAGEHITTLGGHPSLRIGELLEAEHEDVEEILREALAHERGAIAAYRRLLKLVQAKSVALEEYARGMVADEENHVAAIEKMLRRSGGRDAG